MEPFGARFEIEVIETPQPLSGDRSNGDKYTSGGKTKYAHFILNQRTLPLGVSYSSCGTRDDGWCELSTFLDELSTKVAEAEYDYSCNGDWAVVPYGQLTNGVPEASSNAMLA